MSSDRNSSPTGKYDKTALSTIEQIQLLKSRGLIINNMDYAINKLQFIGYYHLSAYFKTFQNLQNNHFH
jgi:abortive infection bacteriophage resistance protein